MALSFNELKSEKAFREIHIPKHICSASSRMETKANEVLSLPVAFFAQFPPTISDFLRKESQGSSVCRARRRALSFLRRLFVCPSNERAQVHLSFQFLSFHNATLWIFIVYSYLPHCIHSPNRPPARLLADASIFEMDLKIESSWPQEAALRSTKAKVTLGMHSATFLH